MAAPSCQEDPRAASRAIKIRIENPAAFQSDNTGLLMKLLGAKLRGVFAKLFEALPPSFAKATEGSPHLHPRGKLRGTRRSRMNKDPSREVTNYLVCLIVSVNPCRDSALAQLILFVFRHYRPMPPD